MRPAPVQEMPCSGSEFALRFPDFVGTEVGFNDEIDRLQSHPPFVVGIAHPI